MSLRVTYDPITNSWELFGRNDGSTAFADPQTGTLTSFGTATDSTHTSVPLTSLGGYWQGSFGANQTAFFDNVSVSVFEPPLGANLYWDGSSGWTATAPGSGGAGNWQTGEGGWDATKPAFFGGTAGTVTITGGGVTSNNAITFEVDGYTVAGDPLTFGGTANTIAVAPNVTATIDSAIAGSSGLTKTQAGALILGGVNTFSGDVTVSAGTLAVAADSALGNASNNLVINGTLKTTSDISLGSDRDLSGAGTLDIAPSTTLTVNGDTSMSALTLANTGTLSLQGATRSVGGLTINAPLELQAVGAISATGLTAPGLTAGTATITPDVVFTSGDKTVNVPGTGTLVLDGDISGLDTNRLVKTGAGTLEVNGELGGGIRVGVANSTDGGTVVLGQAASSGTTFQVQLNHGTLRTDAAGGLTLTPGLSIGGRDTARAVLGAGESMSFAGNVSFFGPGSGDYVLEVNNSSTLNGAVTLATGTSATGWTIRGTGDLTLTGTSTDLTAPITLADSVSLIMEGVTANDIIVGATNTIGGNGTIGGDLTFESGAQFLFDPLKTLTVNGASVSFLGSFGIADLVGFSPAVANGTYTLIDGDATVNTSNLDNLGPGNALPLGGGRSAYFSTGSLVLNVVPEPSALVLAGLGGLLAAGYDIRRRRRHRA